MAKTVADVMKNLDLGQLTVGKDGRLKIGDQDLGERLRQEGVEISDVRPLTNWNACNANGCKPL